MLKIINVVKKYQKDKTTFTALDGISLEIGQDDFISIVGSSGSGKSTLLNIIGGLIRPDSGQVLFNGRNINSMKRHDLELYRKNNIGFVFQQFHLMPYLTLFENIKMVCDDSAVISKIDSYLEECSLLPLKNKYPEELSVGEKQRTAFIRAIITEPDVLLADEPTGNLDPENSRILMALIAEFNKNGGSVVLVSHDPVAHKYANRQVMLQSGKLI